MIKRFSKNKITTARYSSQSTIIPNFNMIGPFLTSLGCPEVLEKEPQIGKFSKNEK